MIQLVNDNMKENDHHALGTYAYSFFFSMKEHFLSLKCTALLAASNFDGLVIVTIIIVIITIFNRLVLTHLSWCLEECRAF